MDTTAPKIVGPRDGKTGFLGTIGVRFMIDGGEADERFSLLEHPMSAKVLAAPLHKHTREDEYSFVLEGSVALLGEAVVFGKPRRPDIQAPQPMAHISECREEPARILEIIAAICPELGAEVQGARQK
jgi:hypothetical protein